MFMGRPGTSFWSGHLGRPGMKIGPWAGPGPSAKHEARGSPAQWHDGPNLARHDRAGPGPGSGRAGRGGPFAHLYCTTQFHSSNRLCSPLDSERSHLSPRHRSPADLIPPNRGGVALICSKSWTSQGFIQHCVPRIHYSRERLAACAAEL